jgi:hypothetical protein
VGTGLVGVVGGVAHGQQLINWIRQGANRRDYPKWEGNENDSANILLCYSTDILYYHCSEPIKIERNFWAIGSGSSLAIGAMAAGANAFRAVEIACEFDTYCGMGIDVIHFP